MVRTNPFRLLKDRLGWVKLVASSLPMPRVRRIGEVDYGRGFATVMSSRFVNYVDGRRLITRTYVLFPRLPF